MVFVRAEAQPLPPLPDSDEESSPLLDQMKTLQHEINQLTDQRLDTDLRYNHMMRATVENLLRAESERAKKEGDAKKADELLKEISDWETVRNSEWDQDLVLLEKRSQLRQLAFDSLMEYNRKLSDKFQAKGNQKKVDALKEGQKFINQMKDLEKQSLQLGKDLMQARENYDFKKSDEIRSKQQELKDQIDELQKKTKSKLRQLEENKDLEEQKL